MPRFQHPLDHVSVASPCKADWDDMIGTERARFCGQCSLNVYNLSAMTRPEAEDLISRTEGRLCIRFFRRADGSIITQNCPVGFAAVRARLKRRATAILTALMTFAGGVGLFSAMSERAGEGETVQGMRIPINRPLRHEEPTVGMMVPVNREDRIGISPATDDRKRVARRTKH